jgi:haloacetate dehalogenase
MNKAPEFAQVNGIRIAYERSGTGYPLVMLHGFPRNRRVWSKLAALLAGRFSMLMPDRRGYGDSDRPSDLATYDNATMVKDVMELTEQLGIPQFVILGHDKGAPTAQRIATDHPDRVRAAVLLDSAPAGARAAGPRDTSGRSWYMDFFRQRGVAEPIVGQNPRLFFSLFLDRNPHLTKEEHEYYLETFCRPGTVEAVISDYRFSLEGDRTEFEEELKKGVKVKVPVLALWGARGPSGRSPVLDLWKEAATDIRGSVITDSAHYVQEEQPQQVAAHILKFADELGL